MVMFTCDPLKCSKALAQLLVEIGKELEGSVAVLPQLCEPMPTSQCKEKVQYD